MKKKKVLKIYSKVNPSIRKKVQLQINTNLKILIKKFNFEMSYFKNKQVLDIASGIGDNSINFAQNGAKVTLIDFNKVSIDCAKKLFKKKKIKNAKFIVGDFFDEIGKIKTKYDFINCTGALHHFEYSYKKSLKKICSLLKPNGYLFLSVGVDSGGFQHKIMKAISRAWGTKENEIIKNSNNLFKEYIKRSIKYGMRTRNQVIFDQFVNPVHNYINIEKLFNFLKKNNLKILQTEPQITSSVGDSVRKSFNIENKFLEKNNFRQQFYWSLKFKDDYKFEKLNNKINKSFFNFINSVNINAEKKKFFEQNKIYKKLILFNKYRAKLLQTEIKILRDKNQFFEDLTKLLSFFFKKKIPSINKISNYLDSSKRLFRNTAGLTLNYFLIKNSNQ